MERLTNYRSLRESSFEFIYVPTTKFLPQKNLSQQICKNNSYKIRCDNLLILFILS